MPSREQGHSPPLPPTVLGGHIAQFLILKARAWRPKTARGYQNILTRFAYHTGDAWPITPAHIMGWLAAPRLNDISIHSYFAHLRTFFNYLQILGVIDEAANPCRQIVRLRLLPAKPHLAPKALSKDEAVRLLAHLRPLAQAGDLAAIRDLALIHFLLISGCRAGETAALCRRHLDLAALSARIDGDLAKTHRSRVVFYNPAVKADLAAWLSALDRCGYRGGPLFTALRGRHPRGQLTPSGVGQLVKRRLTAAGLTGHSVHDLRHTAALLALDAGLSLEKIRDQLGHTDLATTAIYLRARDPDRARAFAALSL